MSVDNLSCNNSINMSNEVFESVEEPEPMSSRTVSADKISTITEVTENSNSNSDHGNSNRSKLYSTQSEPPLPVDKRDGYASDEGIENEEDFDETAAASKDNNERVESQPKPIKSCLKNGLSEERDGILKPLSRSSSGKKRTVQLENGDSSNLSGSLPNEISALGRRKNGHHCRWGRPAVQN